MQHVAMDKLKGRQVIKPRYDNFIGAKWVAPVRGQYFTNVTPITGQAVCEIARSTAEDIELAIDAAHKARDALGPTSAAQRAPHRPRGGGCCGPAPECPRILNKISNRREKSLHVPGLIESIDNGKPIRE